MIINKIDMNSKRKHVDGSLENLDRVLFNTYKNYVIYTYEIYKGCVKILLYRSNLVLVLKYICVEL